jgi:hypothetical protein
VPQTHSRIAIRLDNVQRGNFCCVMLPVANQILNSISLDRPGLFILEIPAWLRGGARWLLLAMGLAAAALAARSWGDMPNAARVLVSAVVPAILLLGGWSRPWQRAVKFVASDVGIAFPSNSMQLPATGIKKDSHWLLVPWANISNVRLARAEVERDPCVAFDVRLTEDERDRFFRHVGRPEVSDQVHRPWFSVAYGDRVPSPEKTFNALQRLQARARG